MKYVLLINLKLLAIAGLPRSGKKVWKMKIFPGKGKVREIWFQSGKLEKNWQKSGKSQEISKFSENWDGYGSLFNFQKHKFTELAYSFVEWLFYSLKVSALLED